MLQETLTSLFSVLFMNFHNTDVSMGNFLLFRNEKTGNRVSLLLIILYRNATSSISNKITLYTTAGVSQVIINLHRNTNFRTFYEYEFQFIGLIKMYAKQTESGGTLLPIRVLSFAQCFKSGWCLLKIQKIFS